MEQETVPDPASLLASDDGALWRNVLARYPQCVEAAAASSKSKAALVELDRWYLQQLAPQLAARLQEHLTALRADQQEQQQREEQRGGGAGSGTGKAGGKGKSEPKAASSSVGAGISRAELVRLVEWKMARGKWRPRLVAFAQEQPDGAVEAASGEALRQLAAYVAAVGAGQGQQGGSGPNCKPAPSAPSASSSCADAAAAALKAAVDALTALKGVGPATASALLSAAAPAGLLPYMGDEALAAVAAAGGSRSKPDDYSIKAYLALVSNLQAKAAALQRGGGGGAAAAGEQGPPAGVQLGAAELERCLWVATVLSGRVGAGGGVGAGTGGRSTGKGAGAAGADRASKRAKR